MAEEQLPTQEQTIKELEEKIKQLEQEREEYLSGWKRAKAEMLQFQKETDERLKGFMLIAHQSLTADLLAILDSFDLAISSLTAGDKETPLGRGYYLIQTQLVDILKKYGLEPLEPEGKKFDPNFYEAIGAKSCEKQGCSGQDDGVIIDVFSRGYLLNGRLLRPAKVRVINHD